MSINDAIEESRTRLDAIAGQLFQQTEHLQKIASKNESPIKLTRLNVVSEAQLRSLEYPENVMTRIFDGVRGQYTKLNHWINVAAAAVQPVLYYGNDNFVLPLDTSPGEAKVTKGDPNELVIPPSFNIYVQSAKPGQMTISVTTYELTV